MSDDGSFRRDASGAFERRRSPRVARRIALRLSLGPADADGWTAVVNRNGALIVCALLAREGDELELTVVGSGRRAACQVVWEGGPDDSGLQKYGVAFTEKHEDFWELGPLVDEWESY